MGKTQIRRVFALSCSSPITLHSSLSFHLTPPLPPGKLRHFFYIFRPIVSKKNKSTNAPAPDLEKSLAELETIVESLENGDLSLDESLKQFERGVALTRQCQAALRAAE